MDLYLNPIEKLWRDLKIRVTESHKNIVHKIRLKHLHMNNPVRYYEA